MIAAGIQETARGRVWSQNCREWVYFNCFIDTEAVRRRFTLGDCVEEHSHRGTHDGQERGLVCSVCHDGVIGSYEPSEGMLIYRG